MTINKDTKTATAIFGNGCFWCTEAIFQQLEGVLKVESGYSGGANPNPTYEEVCTGLTGHAEAARITYDPSKISYATLLEAFWGSHDPTTLNRQGNDVGTQYRSVIYYQDEVQHDVAKHIIAEMALVWDAPIVTELSAPQPYYRAEDYHQNYFVQHPFQGYCAFVVAPKVAKLREVFAEKSKPA